MNAIHTKPSQISSSIKVIKLSIKKKHREGESRWVAVHAHNLNPHHRLEQPFTLLIFVLLQCL